MSERNKFSNPEHEVENMHRILARNIANSPPELELAINERLINIASRNRTRTN